jgi:cytochrome c553
MHLRRPASPISLCFGRTPLLGLALAGVLSAACGGQGGRSPKAASVGAPAVPWSGKRLDERRAFMATHVEPRMRSAFQKFNASAYAGFGCETCHGADMEAVDYRMPNALYPLPRENTLAEAKDYDEETTHFMMTEVVPQFAMLLSKKPGVEGGVTCFTCHPAE